MGLINQFQTTISGRPRINGGFAGANPCRWRACIRLMSLRLNRVQYPVYVVPSKYCIKNSTISVIHINRVIRKKNSHVPSYKQPEINGSNLSLKRPLKASKLYARVFEYLGSHVSEF